jgi:hypothetical protein
MANLPSGKGSLTSTGNLIIVLLLLFVIAAAVLLSIGIPKAGNSDCKNDQSTGIVMTVIGSVFAALGAALGVYGTMLTRTYGDHLDH